MATFALTAGGAPAVADDAVGVAGDAVTVAPGASHPKRPGYYRAVDEGLVDWPGVSLQEAHDLARFAGDLAAAAPALVDVGTAAVTGAADAATAPYTLWEAHTSTQIVNERKELVYEDRMTFRYRQSKGDGAISGVVLVPEKSWCKTFGGLSAFPFTPVTETCWYVIGFDGPDVFSFVTGSRLSTFLGPVRWGTHRTGGSFVTDRDGSYRYDDVSVNGRTCPSLSNLPPGWIPYCGGGGRDEVRV